MVNEGFMMSTKTGRDFRWSFSWNISLLLKQMSAVVTGRVEDSCLLKKRETARSRSSLTAFFVFFYPERERRTVSFVFSFPLPSPLNSSQSQLETLTRTLFSSLVLFSCFFFVCLKHFSCQLDIRTDSTTIQDNSPAATNSTDSIIRTQLDSIPLSFFIPLQEEMMMMTS